MNPEVSIVTPVYNGEEFLEEYFQNILAQTFQNWECIIVNDGSTDNTLSIIEKYAVLDKRISYYTIPNSGIPKVPRDMAIGMAKGNWIVPVDADDLIINDYLEKILLRANTTNADIVLPQMYFFKNNQKEKPLHILPLKKFDKNRILSGKEAVMYTIFDVQIGTNGALIKYTLSQNLSRFRKEINHLRADEFDMRELLLNANSVAFSDAVYFYRQHSKEVTKKITAKSFDYLITDYETKKLIEKHFVKDSLQVKQMQKHRVLGLVSRRILWFKHKSKLSENQKNEARAIFENYTQDICCKYYFDFSVWQKILYFALLQFKLK